MEKREYTRYQIWFPVTIDADSKKVWAVCRDASPGGIMISSASTIAVGAQVTVAFKVAPETAEQTARGSILRIEPNRDDPHGLWPHRIAIEFDQALPDLEGLLQQRGSEIPPR